MAAQETLASRPEQQPGLPGRFKQLSDRTPLRTKLITAVLVLVIAALAAISIASVAMLRNYVETRQDTTLQANFAPFANTPTITGPGGGTINNLPTFTAPNENAITLEPGYAIAASDMIWALQVPGSPINWYFSRGRDGQGPLPQLPTSTTWADSPSGVLITVPSQTGADSWRVIAETQSYILSNGEQDSLTLVAAVDLGNINALTNRLMFFDLVVGGAIVIVLAAVAIGVVRANLRPLNDIELTAGQIAAGHLDHRVPEGDPRTEVGSLGRSLNKMLSQIERAFHAQSEAEQAAHQSEERMRRFIADAAHELRTPLTTIRGFAAHYRQRGGVSRLRPEPPGPGAANPPAAAGSVAGESGLVPAAGPESVRRTVAGSTAESGSAGGDAAQEGLSLEELDHLMGRVESEATRMGMLVEDLLTLARLDQQRPLNLAPVDLLTLAADAVQDARIVSPGRPIDLIVAPGTAFLIDGDEPRLRQVLANLVNNAITHTPAGTPVRVKIGRGTLETRRASAGSGAGRPGPGAAGARGGPAEVWGNGTGLTGIDESAVPAVVIDVEDDGPGMTAEQAQRVFERFYRADAARNRASGGTGLGLAIVAGLVSAHGGTVSLRTAPGKGADFQVRLPLSPDALATDDSDDDLSE